MDELEFTWDDQKAQSNRTKHGVSFEEAKSAFFDENARVIYDPDHSQQEDRFILLGMSDYLRLLIVCHCHRENDTIIRIISARKANKKKKKTVSGVLIMRDNYDFSKSIKNHYYNRLKNCSKKQLLTLFLDEEIVTWYKKNKEYHQTEINNLLKEYIKNGIKKKEKVSLNPEN